MFVVFNRCVAPRERTTEELLARLRLCAGDDVEPSDAAEVPEDEAVERATRQLCPLLELAPGAPASRAVIELAARVAPVFELVGRPDARELALT